VTFGGKRIPLQEAGTLFSSASVVSHLELKGDVQYPGVIKTSF